MEVIYRVKHEAHYTTVRNKTVRDSRLSFKATGLLVYLLSLPDDTRFSRDTLAKVKPDGEKAIRTALAELTRAGYLRREVVSEGRGKLRTITTLRERPLTPDQPEEFSSGLLSPSTPSAGTKRASIRRNKEGARPLGAATPPEDLCAACGRLACLMARDATWWCDEHRSDYELHSLTAQP